MGLNLHSHNWIPTTGDSNATSCMNFGYAMQLSYYRK